MNYKPHRAIAPKIEFEAIRNLPIIYQIEWWKELVKNSKKS